MGQAPGLGPDHSPSGVPRAWQRACLAGDNMRILNFMNVGSSENTGLAVER